MAEVALTELQRDVLRLFFDLPESRGFVLAGGAALVASGLSERPTRDVDLFGSDLAVGVAGAADALEAACLGRGWTVNRIQDSPTFRRFVVGTVRDELLVDLAVDSPPMGAPTITAFGPTYSPEELAARKLLAQLDHGFDPEVLVEMLASLRRFRDEELADLGAEPTVLRAFIDRWRDDRVCGVYGEMTEEHLSSRGAAALPNVPSCNRLVSWAECRAKAVSPRTPTARLVRCRGTGRRHEARRRLPAQIV